VRLQTLRNTVDWSYSLLTGEEQTLFVRLSVFAGGCTFEAAAAVCNPDGEFDLLEGLASLVDKSLVQQQGGEEARFGMLETIRQYAAEKLVQRGERPLLRLRHAEYFDGLAEEADMQLTLPEQGHWLARLEREHDNLRAALTWSLEEGSELGMRVAANLWLFWEVRGHLTEGQHWLETVLTVPEREGEAALRARVLSGAGNLAWRQGNFQRAKELHERALCLRRELGDTLEIAGSLVNLGRVARRQGRDQQARELFEESLRLYRELGNAHGTALVLNCLGLLLQQRGNLDRARALYEDSLQLMRELGETRGMTIASCNLADLAEQQGEYERAQALYAETLRLGRELGEKTIIVETLIGLSAVATHQQQYERALQLLGAADTIAMGIGVSLEPLDLERIKTVSRVAGEALSAEARDSARSQGAAMNLEDAIEYGLDWHGVGSL
jgi:tetratricopeptide (TPR) repeat protein